MPNNNPNTIDFSHIIPASIRAQFEQAELARVSGDFDGALKRINSINMKLSGSYYLLGAMPLILLLCVHLYYENHEENREYNYKEIMLAILLLVTIRQEARDPLLHILKDISVYKAFLHQQKSLPEIDECARIKDAYEREARVRNLLIESTSEINKNFQQALVLAESVGFTSHDRVLLHMAVSCQQVRLQNAGTGLSPLVRKLLDVNVDPNCVLPGSYTDGETIACTFALSSNWHAVSELLNLPNLNVAICPQDGDYKGQSVLGLSAVNNQWDICARIISSFNPNLNQVMEGKYKNRDKDCFGKQIIWVMARAGKSQLVRAMLNKGATVNAESLKKIITCCDLSVIEFGITKGAFIKQQVIDLFVECELETPLLAVLVDLALWDELQDVVYNEAQLSDATTAAIIRKFKEYGDTRYQNQLALLGRDKVNRRITTQLKKEVNENVIVTALLEYSSDTIQAFINLDASILQEMFDIISNIPTIVDPVRVTSTQNTTNLYERTTITRWIRAQYAKDNAEGNILPSVAAHPENRDNIDLDSLVELNAEEKIVLAAKVRAIMDKLVVEAQSQPRLMLKQF